MSYITSCHFEFVVTLNLFQGLVIRKKTANIFKKDTSGAAVLDFLYKRKILRLKPQYDDTFSVILADFR